MPLREFGDEYFDPEGHWIASDLEELAIRTFRTPEVQQVVHYVDARFAGYLVLRRELDGRRN